MKKLLIILFAFCLTACSASHKAKNETVKNYYKHGKLKKQVTIKKY